MSLCDMCHSIPHLPGCPNAPEPKPVMQCAWCADDIFAGDYVYRIEGEKVCTSCVEALKEEVTEDAREDD